MKSLSIIIFYSIVLLGFLSCEKSFELPEYQPKARTVIAYLAANNNLTDEAYTNINQMEAALGDVDGNLIVYARLKGQAPALYRITPDNSNEIKSELIKTYPQHNSSDPEVMKRVFKDIQDCYPAQTYGLILWSHATGWVPPGEERIKLKSFGDDDGNTMDIKDLREALPDNLDYIIFDACSMASVEVLYELKEKATYFIASPAEVVSTGLPYNRLTNDLFGALPGAYERIAQTYYNHYNEKTGLARSATISIIDSKQLDALAQSSRALLTDHSSPYTDLRRSEVQRMDFDRFGNALIAFDFEDFLIRNFGSATAQPVLQQLNRTVLFKANTPFFNGYDIRINGGLSCYIPHPSNEERVHDYYRTLRWYRDGGFYLLF